MPELKTSRRTILTLFGMAPALMVPTTNPILPLLEKVRERGREISEIRPEVQSFYTMRLNFDYDDLHLEPNVQQRHS